MRKSNNFYGTRTSTTPKNQYLKQGRRIQPNFTRRNQLRITKGNQDYVITLT